MYEHSKYVINYVSGGMMLIKTDSFELELQVGRFIYLRLGKRDWFYGN